MLIIDILALNFFHFISQKNNSVSRNRENFLKSTILPSSIFLFIAVKSDLSFSLSKKLIIDEVLKNAWQLYNNSDTKSIQ